MKILKFWRECQCFQTLPLYRTKMHKDCSEITDIHRIGEAMHNHALSCTPYLKLMYKIISHVSVKDRNASLTQFLLCFQVHLKTLLVLRHTWAHLWLRLALQFEEISLMEGHTRSPRWVQQQMALSAPSSPHQVSRSENWRISTPCYLSSDHAVPVLRINCRLHVKFLFVTTFITKKLCSPHYKWKKAIKINSLKHFTHQINSFSASLYACTSPVVF